MLLCVRKSRTSERNPQLDLLDRVNETKLPFAELLGIEFVSASLERIVAEMTVREDLCIIPAVLHGGAIMALARSPWYAGYAALGLAPMGLTPLEDQQLAGLLMWVPGGLVHAGAALWLLARRLAPGRVALREAGGAR